MMIDDAEKQTLLAIAAAEGANFVELAKIAGLDPRNAFRGADLRDVDFQGCDLNGFDFTDADLSGATFEGACLKGAVFSKPPPMASRISTSSSGGEPDRHAEPVALTIHQQQLLDLMREALDERGRALALMPTGTGRSAVMVELIAQSAPENGRTAVIVTSAAERIQIIYLLRERMPGQNVISSRDARETPGWTGIVVHSASVYDNGFKHLSEVTFDHIDLVFSTSLERLQRFIRTTEDRLGFVRMAVFETPLIDIGSRDFARQNRLVRELFDKPTIEYRIEGALKAGQLIQAKIVQPDVPAPIPAGRGMFTSAPRPAPEELLYQLQPVTSELVDILSSMRPRSLLVLCRDAAHAKAIHSLLCDAFTNPEGIRSSSPRWSAEKIRSELISNGGILVAPLSRQSIDAARLLSNVAVFTPMRLALAQELAFRPAMAFSETTVPLVIDFAGAFTGFPSVENVIRLDGKTLLRDLILPVHGT